MYRKLYKIFLFKLRQGVLGLHGKSSRSPYLVVVFCKDIGRCLVRRLHFAKLKALLSHFNVVYSLNINKGKAQIKACGADQRIKGQLIILPCGIGNDLKASILKLFPDSCLVLNKRVHTALYKDRESPWNDIYIELPSYYAFSGKDCFQDNHLGLHFCEDAALFLHFLCSVVYYRIVAYIVLLFPP